MISLFREKFRGFSLLKSPESTVNSWFQAYYRVLHSGGPDGEISASLRYLSQRFSMPNRMATAVLNDIGSEASEMFLSEANAFFDAVATV